MLATAAAGQYRDVRGLLVLVFLVAALGVGACGEDSEQRVPALALGKVSDARESIQALCDAGRPRPDELRPAVAKLLEVVRQYPDRTVQGNDARTARPVPEVALRLADRLENCGADELAQEVRAAVAVAS